MEHLGFSLCNLEIPGGPVSLDITTPTGTWELKQLPIYQTSTTAIVGGQVAVTYSLAREVITGSSVSASVDAAFAELLPLCLGMTYLIGRSISPVHSMPISFVQFMGDPGPHFPRPRAIAAAGIDPVVASAAEFRDRLEAFVAIYTATDATEKTRLLVHHFLDAIACWSLEDLCLSTSTILEIIAATAQTVAAASGQTIDYFVPRIAFAANRFSLAPISGDFRIMRNDLVHEGTLSGTKFPNKVSSECAIAAAAGLSWIDDYMHAALQLGPVAHQRFHPNAYLGLNAFSLD